MPKSKITSIRARQKAIRLFTDRDEFTSSFEKRLSDYSYDKYNIISFYGMGGIGKSALQMELIKRLKEKNDGFIMLQMEMEFPKLV